MLHATSEPKLHVDNHKHNSCVGSDELRSSTNNDKRKLRTNSDKQSSTTNHDKRKVRANSNEQKSSTNNDKRELPADNDKSRDDDLTEMRSASESCRGGSGQSERRRSGYPSGSKATPEQSLKTNTFVKRGVYHVTGEKETPDRPSALLLSERTDESFTIKVLAYG